MTTTVTQVRLDSGETVLVEVHEIPGLQRVGIGEKAAKTFESTLDSVMPAIKAIAAKMSLDQTAETQIKFGIKLGADANAIIAGVKSEANFEVSLTWKPRK